MLIRAYNAERDLPALNHCVMELQNFERGLNPRMPSAASILDKYVAQMIKRCEQYRGGIFVAETQGEVVGYTCVYARMVNDELDDGPKQYALISDLCVLQKYRGRRIGTKLMHRAEHFARDHNAKFLRINVLAANQGAKSLYQAEGFSEFEIILEKNVNV